MKNHQAIHRRGVTVRYFFLILNVANLNSISGDGGRRGYDVKTTYAQGRGVPQKRTKA